MRAHEIRLDGKVAIVTGAARGLGRAMADALHHAGAAVAYLDVDVDGARAAAAAAGAGAVGVGCDITRLTDCERAVGEVRTRLGPPGVLVNCAGKGPVQVEASARTRSHKFFESDPEVWAEVIETNVTGTYYISRAAVVPMIAAGWGRIVNISTSLGTMQRKTNSPYGVSKIAIEAETLIWAQDLDGTGVTVNSLAPGGATDTDFVSAATRKEMRERGRVILMPDVLAAPVVWLASELSAGVTGQRFIGKAWDPALPWEAAVAAAREASPIRPAPVEAR